MSESKTFDGISTEIWERMLSIGRDRHGTTVTETAPHQGTTTTATPFGALVLNYVLDPAANAVTYTIERKPFLVASALIWQGIESTLRDCQNKK